MKTSWLIIVVVVVVVAGWATWRWYLPQPKEQSVSTPRPGSLVPQSTARRLAPEGTYFLLERASLTTDSGVIGFAPGTKVHLDARKDLLSTVTVGQYRFDVASRQLTNDLDIAASVGQSDAAVQAKIGELVNGRIEDHNQQQRDAVIALEREEVEQKQRRRQSAPRAPNPLERGAYNATQDTKYTDSSGRTYWMDVRGRRHYDP
jgi:hypothetical protein